MRVKFQASAEPLRCFVFEAAERFPRRRAIINKISDLQISVLRLVCYGRERCPWRYHPWIVESTHSAVPCVETHGGLRFCPSSSFSASSVSTPPSAPSKERSMPGDLISRRFILR